LLTTLPQTLIIPALISLIIYLSSTYILLPLWQRHRSRTAHYLPLAPSLDSLSSRTSSIRARLQSLAGRYLVPSSWRRRTDIVSAEDDDDEGLDFEDGEELGSVRLDRERRHGRGGDDVRRLSRE
jgi:hypothetical protein